MKSLVGQNISLKAEGDTTLRGATATADRIDVKTGGTLTIESLQDVAESMSKNSQVGGRVQVSFGTAWSADGYASAGKSNGSYHGVGQQSGLFAGDGGYHVDAGHVNLVGGAIASTNATHSELTAQTLTFSDLQNQMQHSTSSGGISGGYGGAMEGNTPVFAGATPNFGGGVPMNEKGGDSSTTYATLTEGNIVIGGQKVTAAELGVNTDAATAHRAIEAMPNAELQLANQQAMANAMGTVVATSKQIAGDIAASARNKTATAYEEAMEGMSQEEHANYDNMTAGQKQEYLLQRSPAYRDAYASQLEWGVGGGYSRALEAVTAALVAGSAGQGAAQVASNSLAPYAAQLIGEKFDTSHGSDPNAVAQALSHALLGAVLAELNGGSRTGGALAGAGGELAAGVLKQAFPDADRETISALSQAVGAIAGSVSGGSLAHAALGIHIAKNAVENNRLLTAPELARIKEISNGDITLEAKLIAAGCALVKCSAGFAEGSAERAEWAAVEALGASSDALEEREWLKAQVLPGYLYTAGNGTAIEEKLFNYSDVDYLFDLSSRNQAGVRALGGLQTIAGAAEVAGGALASPSCASVVACVGVGYLIFTGADNAIAGSNTLLTGKPTATWGGQAIQLAPGISPELAEALYGLTQLGVSSLLPAIKPGLITGGAALEGPGASVGIPVVRPGPTTGGGALVEQPGIDALWSASSLVSRESIGLQWGKGIQGQGMPWEDFLAKGMPADVRLPSNFKTFDFYDDLTGLAISAKTLDTMTASRIANPKQIYTTMKRDIDAAANFSEWSRNEVTLLGGSISRREIHLAVPKETGLPQWSEIMRAVEYARGRGIFFKITTVE